MHNTPPASDPACVAAPCLDHFTAALESERQQISEMLHDQLGQLLTLARMEVASVPADDPAATSSRDNALARLDDCLRTVRKFSRYLHPAILDDIGLLAALETLVEDMAQCARQPIAFRHPPTLPSLGHDHELTLYRAVQEALTNALRHADARSITVSIDVDAKAIRVRVEDDGKGFAAGQEGNEHRSLGLQCMRERVLRMGGEWALSTAPDEGTRIRISLPCA